MQDVLELRRQLLRQRLVRIDFEQRGLAAFLFGDCLDRVEHHGFADAAQSQHDRALGRAPGFGAHDRDPRLFDQLIAPRQLWGRDASAGVVGVVCGLHRIVW